MKGRVLVKLGTSEYGDIPVPPKDYDSITYGEIVGVCPEEKAEYGYLVGRTGHWRRYLDDMRVAVIDGGESLALIDIKDIMGTSHDE